MSQIFEVNLCDISCDSEKAEMDKVSLLLDATGALAERRICGAEAPDYYFPVYLDLET